MININLVLKEKPKVNWRRVGGVALAGALLAGFGLYALTWWISLTEVKGDVAGLSPLEETYRKAIAQSGNLKEREEALAQQIRQLAQIGRNQAPSGQTVVLQSIFAAAPAEVQVTEVTMTRQQVLLLTGQAADFEAAMRYLRALQGLPVLTAVEERKLSTAARGVTTFTFAATVRREVEP